VDLKNDELTIRAEGRRYKIIEAIRVVGEVTGSPDANEVVGKVKSRAFLSSGFMIEVVLPSRIEMMFVASRSFSRELKGRTRTATRTLSPMADAVEEADSPSETKEDLPLCCQASCSSTQI
jgi:hypothetical protein